MTVCILGNGLTALTLAKALVNCEIDVDLFFNKKNYKINDPRTYWYCKKQYQFF
jgi:2-octaprenyl-6-methoxyphenol hydroxylase